MENNKTPNIIDDYIMGRLNKKDRNAFELRLENDTDLAREVKLRREMISGLEAFGRQSMKNELKAIHKEVIHPAVAIATAQKRRRLLPYIAAAASILLLVFALFKWSTGDIAQSSSDLYATHFTPYDISSLERSTNDEQVLNMKQLYKDGKYAEALPLLEAQLESRDPQPSNLLLASGIAHLENGSPEKALLQFKKITTNQDFNFEDEVSWYSALAYLKMDNVVAARNAIQTLINNPSADHHESAKKMFKELKVIKN